MRFLKSFLPCFLFTIMPLMAQSSYHTGVINSTIKSLRVLANGNSLSIPVIELNSDEYIQLSFDVLQHESGQYLYSIIHCDENWEPSILSSIEYMDGFQNLPLNDYAISQATTTSYANYQLLLPNADIHFNVSGNYVVQVRSDNNPDEVLCNACFSVVEPLVQIEGQISTNTDVDLNQTHQQLSFSINHRGISIPNPAADLKVTVIQNGRTDNQICNLSPSQINSNQFIYDHKRELIFDAGNEYRRFEFLSHRYNGMHVERTSFHEPYYHIELQTDLLRSNRTYHYDQDQNGRYIVNSSGANDPTLEADYYIVHFTLPIEPMLDSDIFILGELFNNRLDESSKMQYNFDLKCYTKDVLLKQGLYNYQYLVRPHGQKEALTRPIEGDYFETENEYLIMVYYRPMGERYDHLIGILNIK